MISNILEQFIENYKAIESQRRELKEIYNKLVDNNADELLIEGVFKQLRDLTLKEADILIPLERKT